MMPQMPSREKLLAWIDQVSFAVVEMNLYLDTHPEDEDALAFFREKVELRKVLSNGLCSHGRGKSTGKEGADGCGIMKNASSIL